MQSLSPRFVGGFLLAPVVLSLTACDSAAPTPAPQAATTTSPAASGSAPPPPAAPAKQAAQPKPTVPITQHDGNRFVEELQAAVSKRDAPTINAVFNWDAFLQRVLAGVEMSAADQKLTEAPLLQGAKNGQASNVLSALNSGGTYHFLRSREADGKFRSLWRVTSMESGFNYHDYELAKGNDGKVRAVDVQIVSAGESMSQLMRRNVLPIIATKTGITSDLSAEEQAYVKNLNTIREMMSLAQARDFASALAKWKTLPQVVQATKSMRLFRVTLAQRALLQTEYIDALEELRSAFPKESWIALVSIDAFSLQDKYDQALAAVDELEQSVGGDPYLDAVRGHIYFKQKDYAAADQAANKAIAAVPDDQKGYWVLVDTSLANRDFAATTRALDSLEKLGLKPADIEKLAIFAEYRQSADYRDWRAKHGR
jgi:hypothetical protein